MKTKEERSRICAILAGFLSVLAFVLYNWNNLAGVTHPNMSSWTVWSFITILNFTSYKKLTGDWVKSILPTINCVLCISTALIALRTGSFRSLSGTDQLCLLIGILAGLCWWILKSKDYAETVVQIVLETAIVIGFIPTIVGVICNPSGEPWISWFLWAGAFASQCFAVKFTWRGKLIDFLYPVNMFLFHSTVFVIALSNVSIRKETIGLISGLLVIISVIPYAIGTYRRRIHPNLVSWSIWAVLGLAILLTYRSSGATSNVWPAVFGFGNPLLITILALWRGERQKPNILEVVCVAIGVVSIVLWYFVRDSKELSQYALYIALIADACAAIPTITFVWKTPDGDRPFAWLMFSVGYGLVFFAIQDWSFSNVILPAYMTLGSTSIAIPLVIYRVRNKIPITQWI